MTMSTRCVARSAQAGPGRFVLAAWLLVGALGQAVQAHEGKFAELDFTKAPPGALPWGILSKVGVDRHDGKLRPHFLSGVVELDRKSIVLYGYMTPRPGNALQQRFLLSPRPIFGCECAPLGPEEIVEVAVDKPMRVTDEPLAVRGTLALQQEAPDGVLYRLEHAMVLAPAGASSAPRVAGKRPASIESADRGAAGRASATR
jgi:hypothetical protein